MPGERPLTDRVHTSVYEEALLDRIEQLFEKCSKFRLIGFSCQGSHILPRDLQLCNRLA